MSKQFPKLNEFIAFIKEREKIHWKRVKGQPQPWTGDPILQKYRFCNVQREDDRVTKWIHENWAKPNWEDPDLWFAMYVARVFNKPDTLESIGYPVDWRKKRDRIRKTLMSRREGGYKTFNGAYIVSTHRVAQPKVEYYCDAFDNVWQNRKDIRPLTTLGLFFTRLSTQNGIGGFMGAQIIADVKHFQLIATADWHTFARSGPGSRRGMNWVCGNDPKKAWRESAWHDMLLALRGYVLPKLPKELENLDCQNLQNCLCEFSKYCKVKYLGGRAKQLFRPSEEKYV